MLRIAYPTNQDLISEVLSVPLTQVKEGSGHGGEDYKNGWINGLSMTRLWGPGWRPPVRSLYTYPSIWRCVEALRTAQPGADLFQVMINRLGPHSTLDKHRDGDSPNHRWHYPVVTNSKVRWWDEIYGEYFMGEQFWHGPVNYAGVMHTMKNDGDWARYHIVADLEPH